MTTAYATEPITDYTQQQIEKFVSIIRNQRDIAGLPDQKWGHFDVWCTNEGEPGCEGQHTSPREEGIEDCAAAVVDKGWMVYGGRVECFRCQNVELVVSERDEWEDQAVYAATQE